MRRFINEVTDWIIVGALTMLPFVAAAIFFYGLFCLFAAPACSMEKLGTISRNPFIGDSTSNPFSMYNNPFNPNSPRNRFGPYGNPFSNYSANNPYATQTPGIYGYADESGASDTGYDDGYSSYAAEGGYQ